MMLIGVDKKTKTCPEIDINIIEKKFLRSYFYNELGNFDTMVIPIGVHYLVFFKSLLNSVRSRPDMCKTKLPLRGLKGSVKILTPSLEGAEIFLSFLGSPLPRRM